VFAKLPVQRKKLVLMTVLDVYIGDDVTDENAFAALQDGVTVRVGASPLTSAQYHVNDQKEVVRFLNWMEEIMRQKI
jgi:trehalose-phosphatase